MKSATSNNAGPVDDDGVPVGAPDFIRNRLSPQAFNAKLAAGAGFRGYGVSVTPQMVHVKENPNV